MIMIIMIIVIIIIVMIMITWAALSRPRILLYTLGPGLLPNLLDSFYDHLNDTPRDTIFEATGVNNIFLLPRKCLVPA